MKTGNYKFRVAKFNKQGDLKTRVVNVKANSEDEAGIIVCRRHADAYDITEY